MNNFSVNKRTNSGFSMTFENGYTISVQWGGSTYSTNHGIFNFGCSFSYLNSILHPSLKDN